MALSDIECLSEFDQLDLKRIILLVEDEPSIREMLADTLIEAGYVCVPAATGGDALRIIDADLCRFDLLLSDVMMPGEVNGFDVAQHFQSVHPKGGVLMISGHVDPNLVGSLSKEKYRLLQKPIRLKQLLSVVEQYFENAAAEPRGENGEVVPFDVHKDGRSKI
jgi:DNA-binding NtrC family response regulator